MQLSLKRYAIDAMGAMALGLFASLLMGTILQTIGQQLQGAGSLPQLAAFFLQAGKISMSASGAAMAVAIGYSLEAPPLVLFSLVSAGIASNEMGGAGGPLAVLVVAIIACECGKLISKETPLDILVTPFVTIGVGILLAMWWAPLIGQAASSVGYLINWATGRQPFLMGIVVSVVMGIVLTMPISSAAIAAALGLTGLAGGAAHAGCCAHMVGFAVISFRENRMAGLISQGIGTSMLQFPNLLRHPRLWLPPVLASAITGPLATTVFSLEMNGAPISAGMGTSGLVGPLGVISGWYQPHEQALAMGAVARVPSAFDWLGLALISLVLPAVLSLIISEWMRKKDWIKSGQLKLDL